MKFVIFPSHAALGSPRDLPLALEGLSLCHSVTQPGSSVTTPSRHILFIHRFITHLFNKFPVCQYVAE